MFRDMRRNKQLLAEEATEEILNRGLSGVLAVSGDEGYPYAVPLSYVYERGKIYFHVANSGHKLDGIRSNDKVSFCVIDQDQVVPEAFATLYRSAIVFGRARIVEDDTLKRHALELLVQKYSPGYQEEGAAEIRKDWKAVTVVEIAVEHMTGKVAKGLVNGG
jgi:nitroimidazol reductase NimA-like FMN-containing flavoprotein (pyridoxamine 5'-phosphate oxidase superfamily)